VLNAVLDTVLDYQRKPPQTPSSCSLVMVSAVPFIHYADIEE